MFEEYFCVQKDPTFSMSIFKGKLPGSWGHAWGKAAAQENKWGPTTEGLAGSRAAGTVSELQPMLIVLQRDLREPHGLLVATPPAHRTDPGAAQVCWRLLWFRNREHLTYHRTSRMA